MHIFFSGIGGTAIGPLALIARQAGYSVSGSDKQNSVYIEYLKSVGIKDIHIGQTTENIASAHGRKPMDWLVYSSAVAIENPNHPEIVFAIENNIKSTKRDELLNEIIENSEQKLIAVAGTHGKTTTTAMIIWLMKELGTPISYSVGAKISFGEMGHFDPKAKYFVYECDEYDRNFLAFHPYFSVITGLAYDHHDVFSTEKSYLQAFNDFLAQSQNVLGWQQDLGRLSSNEAIELDASDPDIRNIKLAGEVNRLDGWLAIQAVHKLTGEDLGNLTQLINQFPGVSRRFEKITKNLYNDYAHTPEKIAGCLQLAREISESIVVIYEPLTNKRQYEIRDQYADLFKGVKKLYWVPSYLTREDSNQPVLSPEQLIKNMDNHAIAQASQLDTQLKTAIADHLANGELVVCISGGGGGSLDEWIRKNFDVS